MVSSSTTRAKSESKASQEKALPLLPCYRLKELALPLIRPQQPDSQQYGHRYRRQVIERGVDHGVTEKYHLINTEKIGKHLIPSTGS